MKLQAFQINWVDFTILLVLIVGVVRGKKRGMSEELLDLIKWILILLTAGHLYMPLGNAMADMTPLSHLTCYIGSYAAIIIMLHALFALFHRAVGQKLVTSDAFGSGEYYMGMVAGFVRYFCVIVIVFAFINARQFSTEEKQADETFQENNFGSIRLPTWNRMQTAVMDNSYCGPLARKYLATYLIRPTAPEEKRLGGGRSIRVGSDEVLDKR